MANLAVPVAQAAQTELSKLVQAALDKYHTEADRLLICRLGELLGADYDQSRAWLVYKVATFRGWSEADVAALLRDQPGPDPMPPAPFGAGPIV